MKRLHDWQLRLADFARERRALPFAWGANDCCLFAADAVVAITGEDPAEGLRGCTTAMRAARVLRAHGGVQGLADARLGDRVGPLMARVGDVVLVQIGNQAALGVCNGASLIGPGPGGIVGIGMGHAKAAWRIG